MELFLVNAPNQNAKQNAEFLKQIIQFVMRDETSVFGSVELELQTSLLNITTDMGTMFSVAHQEED